MMLDIKTLMLLYVIVNFISAGAVAVIWGQNRGRFAGITFWLVDMILQAAGAALIVLRGMVPDFVSIVLANTMVQAGALIILLGLERFTGKKGQQIHNYILLAVFIAIFTYYALVQPDLRVRDITLSAMSMIFTFQCGWLLLRRVDPGMRRITRLTGIVFAGYVVFSFTRMLLHIIFPGQTNDFFKAGAVDALAITTYIVLGVCLAVSLVLMVSRRLLADVKGQEEKFAVAFQSSPYAITLTRPSDGKIFEVNDGFERITGYRSAEVIGKTTIDLRLWVREEDRLAVIKELAQGREIHAVEYQFRKKLGGLLTGLFSASIITVNNEKSILSTIADVSDRKQMENRLRKSFEELQSSNAELERFTYTISHDLKSPIVTIKTFLGYLKQDIPGADAAKVAEDMLFMEGAADKMSSLLDELLEMSRIGRVVNPSVTVPFAELVQEALDMVAGGISERGVAVHVSAEELSLNGDRPRLVEIWQNLLENAVKFMGGQASPRIDIGFEQRAADTVFFVRDNGMGIDPRHQSRVFNLFDKLDAKAEGTGLGLAIVRRIVELYKGTAWFESAGAGQGSCFFFTLPAALQDENRGESS
jgi:PAS domain S-box-containing protein